MALSKIASIFFTSDEEAQAPDNAPDKKTVIKFPEKESQVDNLFNSQPTATFKQAPVANAQPIQNPSNQQTTDEHLSKFIDMYQKGFEGLNQSGYDFFEFFKAVMKSGVNNPQVYQMAMEMGLSMDNNATPQKLLSQADFYISEISKVYNQYDSTGKTKKQTLIDQKNHDNQTLTSEILNLKAQLEAINNQIESKQGQLDLIDQKYAPLISEMDSKINANDTAKDKIISSINMIKQGITNHLK